MCNYNVICSFKKKLLANNRSSSRRNNLPMKQKTTAKHSRTHDLFTGKNLKKRQFVFHSFHNIYISTLDGQRIFLCRVIGFVLLIILRRRSRFFFGWKKNGFFFNFCKGMLKIDTYTLCTLPFNYYVRLHYSIFFTLISLIYFFPPTEREKTPFKNCSIFYADIVLIFVTLSSIAVHAINFRFFVILFKQCFPLLRF